MLINLRSLQLLCPSQEFLLFLMPLINVRKIRTRLLRFVSTRANKHKSLNLLFSALPAPVAQALGITARQRLISSATKTSSSNAADKGSTGQRPQGPLHFLPATTCPICYAASNAPPTSLPTDPTSRDPDETSAGGGSSARTGSGAGPTSDGDTSVKIPYVTDCGWGCRYCYYCVVSKLASVQDEGDECWNCLRCGLDVHGVSKEVQERAGGDAGGEDGGGEPSLREGEEEVQDDLDDGEEDGVVVDKVEDGEEPGDSQAEETASVGSEHDRWR